jgi:hypothetical protein
MISAVVPKKDGWVRNHVNETAILRLDIPASGKDRVVTKVTIRAEGGFLFDYTTMYWTGSKTTDFNESAAYRVPSGRFIDEVTLYVDEDVTHLLLVPRVFRWGAFKVHGMKVEKYRVP